MRIKFKRKNPVVLLLLSMIWTSVCLVSCKDEYLYDNKEPDFSGSGFTSIYDFMKSDGNFTYFIRLIDDYGYAEVLSRTGSKTLFPARDEAFERFFQSNPYGVKSYEELTHAQKRNIINISMVNMAYLSYMLSNTTGDQENSSIGEGLAIKKPSANTFLDSIPFCKNESLFALNTYWERFKTKGLWLINNESTSPLVLFAPENMYTLGISTSDFSIFSNGAAYSAGDIYINGIKVVEKDVICKNGYIHVMEDLLLPPRNMAEVIHDNGATGLFDHLLDKFCMPFYVESTANQVHTFYDGSKEDRPLIPLSDSIFVKRYFTDAFNSEYVNQGGSPLTNYGLLHYDPTSNGYGGIGDMGTMFVPTDKAMNDYMNSEKGIYLKDAYGGNWDNVPTPLLALFLKNHQKKSFRSSLPHVWSEMNDESSFPMNVLPGDIEKSFITSNGIVYITNKVYPPVDYQSVYSSAMTSLSTRIMNWGIQDGTLKFFLYLRSMENSYNLIVPLDDAFKNYRDPISWARAATGNGALTDREIWEFKYMPEVDLVYADVYKTDASGNKTGTPIQYTNSFDHRDMIRNRLNDILDMHIVVADVTGFIDSGTVLYARSKGGATMKISGSGANTKVLGGGDLEESFFPAEISKTYISDNGKSYFVDKIVHDPTKSVYTVLGENPEYKHFFDLLNGGWEYAPRDSIAPVFSYKRTGTVSGVGYVVNSFNNFRYTVFVPTKAALEQAFADDPNLWTWEEIAAIDPDREDYAEFKKAKTVYLLEFLKYHFMDNSVYLDGNSFSGTYETAARNTSGKFRKVSLVSDGNNLEITGDNAAYKAKVIKTGDLYNISTRDYIVNNADITKATKIESSSRAVVHLIDNVLKYE